MKCYGLCGCPAVRQCNRAAVCGSVHGSVRAVRLQYAEVRLVVYGSVRGSVRLCGSVWQYERQCAATQCAR
jgi:hypothetical protein